MGALVMVKWLGEREREREDKQRSEEEEGGLVF